MFEDFDAVVSGMMADYGRTGTYVKTIAGVYDPNTGTVTTTEVQATVKLILMDLTLQSNGYSTKYGTLIQAGDKEMYVAPTSQMQLLGIDPATDTVKVGNIVYKVVTFKEVNPTGDRPIVYSLYVRR
jgi:hypothetical protein